jgi:DNA-binding Xre family transcriptional regulator
MTDDNIHIGLLIHNMLKEKEIQITDLANSLRCTKSNVYSIFKRKSIDVDLLMRISKILDYDFLKLYYGDNISPSKGYRLVIDVNELKMKEILSDNSMRIVEITKIV